MTDCPMAKGEKSCPACLDQLPTRQNNALRSLLNKPEIQPEEIAALPYRTVARAPGVGQRSLEIIRAWLHRHGLELSDVPAAGAPKPGARRDCKLVRTIDYLKAQGYKVTRSG